MEIDVFCSVLGSGVVRWVPSESKVVVRWVPSELVLAGLRMFSSKAHEDLVLACQGHWFLIYK